MRVKELITVQIKIDSVWTDYTNGVIDIDIVRGVQSEYIGPWQQCESGVLTLLTRNENLDPHSNSDIRMNRDIRVIADNEPIFTGRISGINVDYQPKGEPPLITITGVDMVGTMALHILRDTFKSRLGSTMSLNGMFQELVMTSGSNPAENPDNYEIIGFTNPYRVASGNGNAANASSGISALTMATILGQTNLDFFYADRNNDMYLYPTYKQKKDDPPKIQLDSRGGATSYRTVELTDGFELLKNKLTINAYGNIIPVYTNNFSSEEWGPQSAVVDTYFINTTTKTSETNSWATAVFQETVNPTREISSISFDGELAPDEVHHIDILDNVYIYHEVTGFDISRKYGIVGIHHRINANDWDITFNLRNMFAYETSFPTPIVDVEPDAGTSDTTYTFTITNLEDIDHTNATYVWKINGATFSTLESPTKTFTVGEAGSKTVTCTITDDYGFIKTSAAVPFVVYGAPPSGVSFTYTPNASNSALIQFVATATNATSYSWNFGDGTTGTGQTVAHAYATSGSKTVVLTATNSYGSTTSTQTFSVTVPPAPTNETGTQGVRYIKIGMDQWNTSGYYWPLMKSFQAKTSATLTDRAANNYIEWGLPYQVYGEPYGNHEWRTSSGALSDVPNVGSCNSITLRTGQGGIKPYNTISGVANWSLIIDLGAIYYDIKTINMSFIGSALTGAPTTLNVYATTYTDSGLGDHTYGPNQPTWVKIGTISRTTGVFTPLAGITMPLDIGEI